MKVYQNEKLQKIIINVSSGAENPLKWSTYCASKAALDMFTQVLQAEYPDNVFAVAPEYGYAYARKYTKW